MKMFVLFLLLIPAISIAQKWDFGGMYTQPEIKDTKVRLKPWDTIRESYTFTPDSFKYSYAVMRPNGRVAVSVDYDEYGAWKIEKDTTLSEPDKHTGEKFSYRRIYASLDDGRIKGFFEYSAAADSTARRDGENPLVFIRNNKTFSCTRKTVRPFHQ